MARKSKRVDLWESDLKHQDDRLTFSRRDVHQSQRLERKPIEKPETKTKWKVLTGIIVSFVFLLVWLFTSVFQWGSALVGSSGYIGGQDIPSYVVKTEGSEPFTYCYQPADESGQSLDPAACYDSEKEVPEPAWHSQAQAQKQEQLDAVDTSIGHAFLSFPWWKLMLMLLVPTAVGSIAWPVFMRRRDVSNVDKDHTDIQQHTGDQHIALPGEIMEKFAMFPNIGAHASEEPTALISHAMFTNKGVNPVEVSRRAKEDIYDEDGDLVYYKGEILEDDEGNILTEKKPFIDEELGSKLWDASGLPDDPRFRIRYDPNKIPYNPRKNPKDKKSDRLSREKLGYDTVADYINNDWIFPSYETDRPTGAYIVDTAPVNTMVLAMTRAGKGQTYIEPTIDMWTRERHPNNGVINDPKGELLVKNYVRMALRGYQVVQFNLINAMKTDIYNPLAMACEAAREDNFTKVAEYVENIGDVFFPKDGGDDPVWANSASNAFKRAVYGLIDYYLDKERQMRILANRQGMDYLLLENELDALWGKVSMYNVYQMFVQLSAKKKKSPLTELQENEERYIEEGMSEQEFEQLRLEAEAKEFLWDGEAERDLLTLYFNATEALPRNEQRRLVLDAHNSLKSMGGAEKMLASVYGIAITGLNFFTDPTIATLTSGTPSQNVDLGGLSFPRRFGVQFNMNYLKKKNWIGKQAVWSAYADSGFTKNLGKAFEHRDIVSREGWAQYYFEGKFPDRSGYVKLEIRDASSMLLKTFYFKFVKGYQMSLDGKRKIKDPVKSEYIIKNGSLIEVIPNDKGVFERGDTSFKQKKLKDVTEASEKPTVYMASERAIQALKVRYSEQTKMVFLVTPPHLMKYAKLILILITQLVNLNFDKSYMTKENQKPQHKTRFMLDELGNLQSEGHGINSFETYLSIGLGQGQEFTLILQTLQQLRDVYGESVDKIVQGNAADIIFLKSTDDAMLETLEKMSGKTHRVYGSSKTVTRDLTELVGRTEGKVSYTYTDTEEPVISYTDMAMIADRNSMVFRAGDSPIWNRDEMILPMSFRMFKDAPKHAGHNYSLQTIPTLSTAMEFDVRQNQPNFDVMFTERVAQARHAQEAMKMYQEAYGYSDFDITRLDANLYSNGVMEIVDLMVNGEIYGTENPEFSDAMAVDEMPDRVQMETEGATPYDDVFNEVSKNSAKREEFEGGRYADGQLAKSDLINENGSFPDSHNLRTFMADFFYQNQSAFDQDPNFSVVDGHLMDASGKTIYITKNQIDQQEIDELNAMGRDINARVYTEDDIDTDTVNYTVDDAFFKYLASLPDWNDILDGRFDRAVAEFMRD